MVSFRSNSVIFMKHVLKAPMFLLPFINAETNCKVSLLFQCVCAPKNYSRLMYGSGSSPVRLLIYLVETR